MWLSSCSACRAASLCRLEPIRPIAAATPWPRTTASSNCECRSSSSVRVRRSRPSALPFIPRQRAQSERPQRVG